MRLRNPNRAERRTLVLYRRADGLWAWRLIAPNGQIIATDGGQGYHSRADAADIAESVTGLRPDTPAP